MASSGSRHVSHLLLISSSYRFSNRISGASSRFSRVCSLGSNSLAENGLSSSPLSARRNLSSASEQILHDKAKSTNWRKYAVWGLCASAGIYLLKQYSGSSPPASSQSSNSGELVLPPKLAPAGLPESFITELQQICEEARIIYDLDERNAHGKPWNSYHKIDNVPDVVVYPLTNEEVVGIVKLCQRHKVPITAYGAATSLEGHTMTMRGGVSINMTMMKKVKELHMEDMDVVVEPGIGWMELNAYLKPKGLFFPLDPGPGATIGGMCATRCSGSLAVRYGTMRDNVISLKAVMANGDVVKTGTRARKSAAGYDLTRLLIGSEGTLGIITEVTLRLQKIPEASTVAMCCFPSIKDAADVAIEIMHSGIQASRVELLDSAFVNAVNQANGTKYKEAPTLMFELIGTEAYALEQTTLVKNIAKKHHGSTFTYAETTEEKEELWKARKEAYWAFLALGDGEALTTDVCVPLSRLAECISIAKIELDRSPLLTGLLAHAGDGNFHTCIIFDPTKKEQVKEALRLSDLMVNTALAMEGTCTGEHGVGIGKMKYLEKELGPEAMKVMGSIKEVLDPDNLMNPGKIIPPQFCY